MNPEGDRLIQDVRSERAAVESERFIRRFRALRGCTNEELRTLVMYLVMQCDWAGGELGQAAREAFRQATGQEW